MQTDILSTLEGSVEFTAKQAANTAEVLLSYIGYQGGGPVPVITMIRKCGVDVRHAGNVPDGAVGVLYAGGKTQQVYGVDAVIFLDKSYVFAYKRFVMAFLFGHYLFDYLGSTENRQASQDVRTFERMYSHDTRDSKEEVRAGRFAAALLMPVVHFVNQYNYAMDKHDNRIYTIKYLSKFFQVEEFAVEMRIHEILYGGGY